MQCCKFPFPVLFLDVQYFEYDILQKNNSIFKTSYWSAFALSYSKQMWRTKSPVKRISEGKAALFAPLPRARSVLSAGVGLPGTPRRAGGICQQN